MLTASWAWVWYLNLILALEQKIVFRHQQVQPKSEREPLSALQITHAEFFVCSHVCWTSEMTIRLNEDGADSQIVIIKWGSARKIQRHTVLMPTNSALKKQWVGPGLFILRPIRTTLSEEACLPAVNHTGTTQPYSHLKCREKQTCPQRWWHGLN